MNMNGRSKLAAKLFDQTGYQHEIFGKHRDALFDSFACGLSRGLLMMKNLVREDRGELAVRFLGEVVRNVESGWSGVVFDITYDHNDEVMLHCYNGPDDIQFFAPNDVTIVEYPVYDMLL